MVTVKEMSGEEWAATQRVLRLAKRYVVHVKEQLSNGSYELGSGPACEAQFIAAVGDLVETQKHNKKKR